MGRIHKEQVQLVLLGLFNERLQGLSLKALLNGYLGSLWQLFDFAPFKFVFLKKRSDHHDLHPPPQSGWSGRAQPLG